MGTIDRFQAALPNAFLDDLISLDEQNSEIKDAKTTRKIDSGIEAQKRVIEVPAAKWQTVLQELSRRRLLTPTETGVLQIAVQIPAKMPTEKQSLVLIDASEKARQKGLVVGEPEEETV